VPDHESVIVITKFTRHHARRIFDSSQLTTMVIAPACQQPGLLTIRMAGLGNPGRETFIAIKQRDINGTGGIMNTHQPPMLIPAGFQHVAVLIAERCQSQY
jgi:hypothetical protein